MQGLILNAKHPITININVEKYLFISTCTITIVCIEIHINIYPVYISDYNLKLTNLDWILEQLDKPKVISSGQELSVLGETGGVDICDVTLWWPDPLARLP